MKHVDPATVVVVMSVKDKRERLAQVLERAGYLYLADSIEHYTPDRRAGLCWQGSPMEVAARDKVLSDAGLKGATVGEFMNFFEMTDAQLHAISCNCGGHITGQEMARRIRGMKTPDRGPGIPGAGLAAAIVFSFILSGAILAGSLI